MPVDASPGDFESALKPLWLRAQAGDEAAYRQCLRLLAARLRGHLKRRLAATPEMARPGSSLRSVPAAVAALPAGMLLIGAIALMRAPAGSRLQTLLGHSWWICPWGVLALSMPALAAAVWAVRGLAPTRPARTGFAAGVFAGAVGACGYSLACPESSPAFVAVWYTLGIALAGGAGALAGRHAFRW